MQRKLRFQRKKTSIPGELKTKESTMCMMYNDQSFVFCWSVLFFIGEIPLLPFFTLTCPVIFCILYLFSFPFTTSEWGIPYLNYLSTGEFQQYNNNEENKIYPQEKMLHAR